ncbi:MAG: hypothetical protein IK073_01580 [Paludibacteraceae bacterium]|nr:hypothetical protein [Paludibacteraceae bacterium]
MRRLLLSLVLGTLSLGTFAQEAFYIYRNDGDFNGFFYDEVVEMRYSKIALDSTEREQYVTYEVELADTTYRIPLAAIDSIGFQQPEIRFNPKVKLIQNEGLSPYLKDINEYGYPEELVALFEDLPMALVPQVGDVLIGVGTDDCGEVYEKLGGSFSLVVQRVSSSGNQIFVYGRQVEEVGEVFEQFISVEQIGVDEEGKIRRRIAGCDENGLPRRITQVEGDHFGELINFNGNINKDWSIPNDSSKVVLNADINFQVFMRAQYNITLLGGVYVKITNEFRTRVKPSLAISLNGELRANSDNPYSIYLSEVLFPVSCPVFAIKPWPSYFMHLSGSIDAKLNFPQIYLGMGIEYTINSNNLFPLGVNIYWAPDDGTKPDDEMLSAEFSVSGSIHQGIEFEGMISTASWFKKVLQVAAGVHFYVGPKMTASISFKHDFFQDNYHNSLYTLLSSGKIDLSLISILMELSAKTKLGWYDPQEKTFFSGTKDFLEHQIRLLPVFDKTEVEFTETDAIVKLKPKSGTNLKFTTYYLGIYDAAQGLSVTDDSIAPKEIMQGNRWIERESDEEIDHITTIPLQRLEVGKKYFAVPVIDDNDLNFIAHGTEREFSVPLYMKMDKDSLHFDVSGNPKQTINFTTNCSPDMMRFVYLWDLHLIDEDSIETLDKANGNYQLHVKAAPNRYLFGQSCNYSKKDYNCPYLNLLSNSNQPYPIGFSQDDNDLSNVHLTAGGRFKFIANGDIFTASAHFEGMVSATRTGDSIITISGTSTSEYETSTIQLTLVRQPGSRGYGQLFKVSGTITTSGIDERTTITFADMDGVSYKTSGASVVNTHSGTITSGVTHVRWNGLDPEQTYNMSTDQNAEVYVDLYPKVPGDE